MRTTGLRVAPKPAPRSKNPVPLPRTKFKTNSIQDNEQDKHPSPTYRILTQTLPSNDQHEETRDNQSVTPSIDIPQSQSSIGSPTRSIPSSPLSPPPKPPRTFKHSTPKFRQQSSSEENETPGTTINSTRERHVPTSPRVGLMSVLSPAPVRHQATEALSLQNPLSESDSTDMFRQRERLHAHPNSLQSYTGATHQPQSVAQTSQPMSLPPALPSRPTSSQISNSQTRHRQSGGRPVSRPSVRPSRTTAQNQDGSQPPISTSSTFNHPQNAIGPFVRPLATGNRYSGQHDPEPVGSPLDFEDTCKEVFKQKKTASTHAAAARYAQAARHYQRALTAMDRVLGTQVLIITADEPTRQRLFSLQQEVFMLRKEVLHGFMDAQTAMEVPSGLATSASPTPGAPPSYDDVLKEDQQRHQDDAPALPSRQPTMRGPASAFTRPRPPQSSHRSHPPDLTVSSQPPQSSHRPHQPQSSNSFHRAHTTQSSRRNQPPHGPRSPQSTHHSHPPQSSQNSHPPHSSHRSRSPPSSHHRPRPVRGLNPDRPPLIPLGPRVESRRPQVSSSRPRPPTLLARPASVTGVESSVETLVDVSNSASVPTVPKTAPPSLVPQRLYPTRQPVRPMSFHPSQDSLTPLIPSPVSPISQPSSLDSSSSHISSSSTHALSLPAHVLPPSSRVPSSSLHDPSTFSQTSPSSYHVPKPSSTPQAPLFFSSKRNPSSLLPPSKKLSHNANATQILPPTPLTDSYVPAKASKSVSTSCVPATGLDEVVMSQMAALQLCHTKQSMADSSSHNPLPTSQSSTPPYSPKELPPTASILRGFDALESLKKSESITSVPVRSPKLDSGHTVTASNNVTLSSSVITASTIKDPFMEEDPFPQADPAAMNIEVSFPEGSLPPYIPSSSTGASQYESQLSNDKTSIKIVAKKEQINDDNQDMDLGIDFPNADNHGDSILEALDFAVTPSHSRVSPKRSNPKVPIRCQSEETLLDHSCGTLEELLKQSKAICASRASIIDEFDPLMSPTLDSEQHIEERAITPDIQDDPGDTTAAQDGPEASAAIQNEEEMVATAEPQVKLRTVYPNRKDMRITSVPEEEEDHPKVFSEEGAMAEEEREGWDEPSKYDDLYYDSEDGHTGKDFRRSEVRSSASSTSSQRSLSSQPCLSTESPSIQEAGVEWGRSAFYFSNAQSKANRSSYRHLLRIREGVKLFFIHNDGVITSPWNKPVLSVTKDMTREYIVGEGLTLNVGTELWTCELHSNSTQVLRTLAGVYIFKDTGGKPDCRAVGLRVPSGVRNTQHELFQQILQENSQMEEERSTGITKAISKGASSAATKMNQVVREKAPSSDQTFIRRNSVRALKGMSRKLNILAERTGINLGELPKDYHDLQEAADTLRFSRTAKMVQYI